MDICIFFTSGENKRDGKGIWVKECRRRGCESLSQTSLEFSRGFHFLNYGHSGRSKRSYDKVVIVLKHHIRKTYIGVELNVQSFINSELDGCDSSASCSDRFTARKE
jgi:hypothetical protein